MLAGRPFLVCAGGPLPWPESKLRPLPLPCRAGSAPEPDSRRAPLAPRGPGPHTLALGCHRRTHRRRHRRGRDRNDRRRGLVVAPGQPSSV